ncbi:MAG: FHA domain-containing protein [Planctomycetaceae bacterium]
MPGLQQIFGSPPLAMYELSSEVTTVGRHEDCDIVLDSPAISRCHARVYLIDGRCFVEDNHSRNGTMLNGTPVHSRTPLNDGDEVEFSTLPFRFVEDTAALQPGRGSGSQPEILRVNAGSSQATAHPFSSQTVIAGDRVPLIDSDGSARIHDSRIRHQLAAEEFSHPERAVRFSSGLEMMSLLQTLRTSASLPRLADACATGLLNLFPSASQVAILNSPPEAKCFEVLATKSRIADVGVKVALPVVRQCRMNSVALCCSDRTVAVGGRESTPVSLLVAPCLRADSAVTAVIQLTFFGPSSRIDENTLALLLVLAQVFAVSADLLSFGQATEADSDQLGARETEDLDAVVASDENPET